MSFVANLQRAREVLEQQGRLSVRARALARELDLAGHDALAFNGRLPETLRVAEAGIARCPREVPADESTGSFHPLAIMQFFKGWSLEWRGELTAVLGDEAGRAELLREAQQGYHAVGTPNHAARIAGVLGS